MAAAALLAPSGAAAATCRRGEPPLHVTVCLPTRLPRRCYVDLGYCAPTGGCTVNLGYCGEGARCVVNAGTCEAGDDSVLKT